MAHRPRGPRSKTRHKLSKKARNRGVPPVTRFVQKFSVGDKVSIFVEPSVHKGLPSARFHGLTGKVVENRGTGYVVEVNDTGKSKQVVTSSVHLRRM